MPPSRLAAIAALDGKCLDLEDWPPHKRLKLVYADTKAKGKASAPPPLAAPSNLPPLKPPSSTATPPGAAPGASLEMVPRREAFRQELRSMLEAKGAVVRRACMPHISFCPHAPLATACRPHVPPPRSL